MTRDNTGTCSSWSCGELCPAFEIEFPSTCGGTAIPVMDDCDGGDDDDGRSSPRATGAAAAAGSGAAPESDRKGDEALGDFDDDDVDDGGEIGFGVRRARIAASPARVDAPAAATTPATTAMAPTTLTTTTTTTLTTTAAASNAPAANIVGDAWTEPPPSDSNGTIRGSSAIVDGGNDNSDDGNNNNDNNNPQTNAFMDFLTVFFKKAQSYEHHLERKESLREGNDNGDGGDDDDGDEYDPMHRIDNIDEDDGGINGYDESDDADSSPSLPSQREEAMAAVEALADFKSFAMVRRRHSEDSSGRGNGDGGGSRRHPAVPSSQKAEQERQPSPPRTSSSDWRAAWEAFLRGAAQRKESEDLGRNVDGHPKEILVGNLPLSCSIDDFHDLILRDDAPHSIGGFMHRNFGDSNVETTPWTKQKTSSLESSASSLASSSSGAEEGDTASYKAKTLEREIRYVHPINAPMAPPTARARKSQTIRRFGGAGLCLDTCTVVEDVPMTDCFVVHDRLTLSSTKKKGGKGGGACSLAVRFEIRFIKGTMFRRIIESTTRRDFQKFWGKFGGMAEGLAQQIAVVAAADREGGEEIGAGESEAGRVFVVGEDREGGEATASSLRKKTATNLRLSSMRPSFDDFAADGALCRGELGEDKTGMVPRKIHGNTVVVYGVVFLSIVMTSLFAAQLWQTMETNRFLSVLDRRLEELYDVNTAILLRLNEEERSSILGTTNPLDATTAINDA